MTVDKDILSCFFEESKELIDNLQVLGTSLRGVGIPDEAQSKTLAEFAQKLNRLIGGTASVGFDAFAPLSRKTAMLAERCADIREMTIRLLIVNLNNVVALFSDCIQDIESMEEGQSSAGEIEKRIDICLNATGVGNPEVKSQGEIDDLLADMGI
jgi:chemotaxis protein histidine kinase CheA